MVCDHKKTITNTQKTITNKGVKEKKEDVADSDKEKYKYSLIGINSNILIEIMHNKLN